MGNYKILFACCVLFIVFIFASIKLNLSTLVIQPSPFGADITPPGPAQYTDVPPKEIADQSVVLKGNAEANSRLTALVNEKAVAKTSVNEASIFNIIVPLDIGENNITLLVIDKSGNISEPSINHKIIRNP